MDISKTKFRNSLLIILFVIGCLSFIAYNVRANNSNERKPIAIAGTNAYVWIICNDGSIWGSKMFGGWDRMQNIPQD